MSKDKLPTINHQRERNHTSHLTTAPVKILDLEALRSAAASFGATMEKASTFTSFQRNQQCEYAIKLPGVRYQVGVLHDPKTKSYSLHYDPFEAEWGQRPEDKHDGHKLEAAFGKDLQKLSQQYAVQVVTRQAKAKGWMIQHKTLANGSVQLVMMQA